MRADLRSLFNRLRIEIHYLLHSLRLCVVQEDEEDLFFLGSQLFPANKLQDTIPILILFVS